MFSLLSIVIFIMAVFFMNKMFIGFQPGSKRVNTDVSRFRAHADKWKETLVAWTQEDMELFSWSEINKVKKTGFGKTFEAIIESIYHEPMLYYYYKEYPAAKKNAILFAQSASYEFVYRLRSKGVQVFVNEDFMGTIGDDGSFYNEGNRSLLGKIDRHNETQKFITVGDKIMGSILFPTEVTNVKPRVFDLDVKITEEEKPVFMAMSVYEVIMHLNRT